MKKTKYKTSMIISGGQTGADRAGLDFAISKDIKHGGWCPKGRLAEDGTIPEKYNLIETSTNLYPQRTKQNVKDSDATIIFTDNHMSRGALLTITCCKTLKKPHFILPINHEKDNAAIECLANWLKKIKPKVLNIAGARESKCPQMHKFVITILNEVLEKDENSSKTQWPPFRPTTPSFDFGQPE